MPPATVRENAEGRHGRGREQPMRAPPERVRSPRGTTVRIASLHEQRPPSGVAMRAAALATGAGVFGDPILGTPRRAR